MVCGEIPQHGVPNPHPPVKHSTTPKVGNKKEEKAMKIRWLQHPTKPELNNTEQHISREAAHVAVDFGQAVLCPPPKRGTNEYLAWRREQSATAVPQANDTAIPYVDPPQWEAFDADGSNFQYLPRCKKARLREHQLPDSPDRTARRTWRSAGEK